MDKLTLCNGNFYGEDDKIMNEVSTGKYFKDHYPLDISKYNAGQVSHFLSLLVNADRLSEGYFYFKKALETISATDSTFSDGTNAQEMLVEWLGQLPESKQNNIFLETRVLELLVLSKSKVATDAVLAVIVRPEIRGKLSGEWANNRVNNAYISSVILTLKVSGREEDVVRLLPEFSSKKDYMNLVATDITAPHVVSKKSRPINGMYRFVTKIAACLS